jgi:hypothetical protein
MSLDVFGPTFQDTARRARSKAEILANRVHTQTSLRAIRRNMLIHLGDTVDVEKIMDNERIIRSLPYIRDAIFMLTPNALDTARVDMTVMTKDVFSFGIGLRFGGIKNGNFEVYNHNMWGIGHQLSAEAVGHVEKKPNLGFQASYGIKNIAHNIIDAHLSYFNTYRQSGIIAVTDKEFLRMSTRWGGGLSYTRLKRINYLVGYNDMTLDSVQLNFGVIDAWAGYALLRNETFPHLSRASLLTAGNVQLVFSGRYCQTDFYSRIPDSRPYLPYFADSKLMLGSVSLSRRTYSGDTYVYGFGATEDVPHGFLHECVVGYDHNERGDRWYSHLYMSTGNLLGERHAYWYASGGIGGFYRDGSVEQGIIDLRTSVISHIYPSHKFLARFYGNVQYLVGINRFPAEKLFLRNDDTGIRGFRSREANGAQRLTLKTESVFFHRKPLLGFTVAFYVFTDVGFIAPERRLIFRGDFYSGLGGGIRVRNENLVLRTIFLRIAYFPNPPSDFRSIGFMLTERNPNSFYGFQPRKPNPLPFW